MNDKVIETFKKNLTTLRKRYGCTCKQLSELIGCDSSYISKVENGRINPAIDKIIAIANHFGVNFIDLFKE